MTTNAFRHRPPEQCTLSKEDQQHILHISNNDQELLDELMAILRQLRPLPPRGASVRHTSRCDRRALQTASDRLRQEHADWITPATDEMRQDIAFCQYTSGSSPRCLFAYQDCCTPSGRVLTGGD